ncbi:MerR family transcriptional regulator [Streptomyces sp. HNM0663]|uniref:MerR family transcriptional regulator n=1 Tax=Streptomyces chengmaiensis TaxID=3040919 RepID=A0ABT6HV82_9ACTN|nr:MerR family transcriptional regulator [Streptomyces chengmaiensis]MDH2392623.1 MerR family transcriptional regulator [Streptomyces chengmaiensis]
MRIGELSRRTGVPVPTIKYYVREGLLPAGELTSPNQASYGVAHERRLRLIRALLDVGGLSVAAIREVLSAVDAPGESVHKVLGAAADRMVPGYGPGGTGADESEGEPDAELEAAREDVRELIARRGWDVDDRCPAAEALAGAVAALDRVGQSGYAEVLDAFAEAAEKVAQADIAYVKRRVALDDLVESVVIGTVVGDAMFAALRRLAHVDASAREFAHIRTHD